LKLFFIRHGVADRSAWDGDDFDRPLTQEGREKMDKTARRLREIGFRPDIILSSPLARAVETAQIVADVLGRRDRVVVDKRVDPEFDISRLRSILSEHSKTEEIALVGHEPGFSTVVGALIGGGLVVCKKGSVARVDMETPESNHGELLWLLQPNTLVR
jgi:phosphohistidine phosphatase